MVAFKLEFTSWWSAPINVGNCISINLLEHLVQSSLTFLLLLRLCGQGFVNFCPIMPSSIRCFHTSCSCSWNSSSRQRWSSVSLKSCPTNTFRLLQLYLDFGWKNFVSGLSRKTGWVRSSSRLYSDPVGKGAVTERSVCLQSQSCTNPPSTSWSSPRPPPESDTNIGRS